jgi:hypothetical protein
MRIRLRGGEKIDIFSLSSRRTKDLLHCADRLYMRRVKGCKTLRSGKMSKKQNQHQGGEAEAPKICKAEGCKAKPSKFGFCKEHYELYMAGVIKGDGSKPVDYEQKLALYLKRNQKQAA